MPMRDDFKPSKWRTTRRLLAALLATTGLASSLFAFPLPPIWRWSNPLPHGANVYDITYAGGTYVQVAERGQIFMSEDGLNWLPHDTGVTNALRAVTFFGGRLVITGENGVILLSDNLTDFYSASQATTDWLEGVAASTNLIVTVGDNAAIYTSTNAVIWRRVTVSFANWLSGVAFGTNTFVIVGDTGFIATSPDGATWTPRASGTSANLNRVAWLGDRFLAVGDGGKVLTSPRGDTWQPVTTGATNALYGTAGVTNSRIVAGTSELRLQQTAAWSSQLGATRSGLAPDWKYYAAVWDGSGYVVSGPTGLTTESYSTNGATYWYTETNSIRTWLWQVTHTPSNYLAVGDFGTILTSPNGINWDLELTPDAATNTVLLGAGGSTNLFLIAGTQGTVLWATNTFLWNVLTPRPTTNDLQGVGYNGQQFILCGGNGTILTSPNGTNWTPRATPTTAFLMSVDAFPGGLVAAGDQGVILTSADSTNWVRQASGTTNWLSHVRYLNGLLMAVGANGTLLTSTNGTNWAALATGTTNWLNAIDYASGAWFIAGNQGTMLISTNATTWLNSGTITRKSLYGLVIHQGQLVTVGSEGVIIRSQLVPASTPVNIAQYSRPAGQNLFLFTGQPDQRFYLQQGAAMAGSGAGWTNTALLEFFDSTGTLLYLDSSPTNVESARFFRTVTTN